MRKFTDEENIWIKRFVDTKEKGTKAIQDLQVAKLLRSEFSFFALKWTYGSNPQISLYNRDVNIINAENQYYRICDFIYFIQELEALGFIAIQKIPQEDKSNGFNVLYNKDKYIYNEKLNEFKPKKQVETKSIMSSPSGKEAILEDVGDGFGVLFQITQTQNINLDFANILQKYGLGIIYPLPLAKDYVDNKFKTLEDRHHEEEMDIALDSAKYSKIATMIAFFSLLISIGFGMYQTCTPQEINPNQINMIKKSIQCNHIVEPLRVEINDTVLCRPIVKGRHEIHLSKPVNSN